MTFQTIEYRQNQKWKKKKKYEFEFVYYVHSLTNEKITLIEFLVIFTKSCGTLTICRRTIYLMLVSHLNWSTCMVATLYIRTRVIEKELYYLEKPIREIAFVGGKHNARKKRAIRFVWMWQKSLKCRFRDFNKLISANIYLKYKIIHFMDFSFIFQHQQRKKNDRRQQQQYCWCCHVCTFVGCLLELLTFVVVIIIVAEFNVWLFVSCIYCSTICILL